MYLHYEFGGDDLHDGVEYEYEASVGEGDVREFLEGCFGKDACKAIDEYDQWDAFKEALADDRDFREFMKEKYEDDASEAYYDGLAMQDTYDSLNRWLDSGGW